MESSASSSKVARCDRRFGFDALVDKFAFFFCKIQVDRTSKHPQEVQNRCSEVEQVVLRLLCGRAAALVSGPVRSRILEASEEEGRPLLATYLFCVAAFVLYGMAIAEPTGADVSSGDVMRFYHSLFSGPLWEMTENGASVFPVDRELMQARRKYSTCRRTADRATRRQRRLSGTTADEVAKERVTHKMLEVRSLEKMLRAQADLVNLKVLKSRPALPPGAVAFPLASFEQLAVKLCMDPEACASLRTLRGEV